MTLCVQRVQADPAPSASSTPQCNEFLALSPVPRAYTACPSGLNNAHCSQGHSCRNHSSVSLPQARQLCSAWCRHQRLWKAVPGAAVGEGKGAGYRDFESSKSRGALAMQKHVENSSLGSGLGGTGGSQGHSPLPGHPQQCWGCPGAVDSGGRLKEVTRESEAQL